MELSSTLQLETADMAEADALVALMLRRGERNATYARVLNERRGIHSPLRRFAAADMLDAFNVTLLRKTVVTPEAAAFINMHEANSAYADYYATALPWSHYLSNNPSAPYREQDLESLYYIRYSNSVRGHGLFASEALPTGTVLGQVRESVPNIAYLYCLICVLLFLCTVYGHRRRANSGLALWCLQFLSRSRGESGCCSQDRRVDALARTHQSRRCNRGQCIAFHQ